MASHMTRQLKFVTTNKGKYESARSFLADKNIKIDQFSLEIPELRTNDIEKIAIQKAMYAFKEVNDSVVVHDTGFYIDSLNGYPGFSVGYVLEKIGIEKLLKLLKEPSKATFVSYLGYMDRSLSSPVVFQDSYSGLLLNVVEGKRKSFFWSDLFLSFVPDNKSRTLSSFSEKEFRILEKSIENESCFYKFANWYISREDHE